MPSRSALFPSMRLSQRSRPGVSLPTLCGLALGLAVVMWGADYKMTQYSQEGCAFRVMAPAKLLTEKERPMRIRGWRIVLATAAGQRPLLWHLPAWTACVRRPALRVWPAGALVRAMHCRKIVFPEFTYFSSRPPPLFLIA